MKKLIHLMLRSCKEVIELSAKSKVQKLSRSERIKLRIHLGVCKYCRDFEKQGAIIDKALEKISSKQIEYTSIPNDELKSRIINGLKSI